MHNAKFDVVGIGNALVDVLSSVSNDIIAQYKLTKGEMRLIGTNEAAEIYEAIGTAKEVSGGSGANTVAGIASLGGKAAYIGKVANDKLGHVFASDIQSLDVHFNAEALFTKEQLGTGRCLVLITDDAERTMCTYLGASATFGAEDLDQDIIQNSAVCYLEGYLFDAPPAKHAFYQAASLARQAGRKTALTLSDVFCVERHRDDFQALIEREIDIVFANEAELISLYKAFELDEALMKLRKHVGLACVTRSEKGSVVIKGDQTIQIDAAPVKKVIDTTGAGDLYAAGFLYGYTKDLPLEECGRIASICAAEVISHIGARPEQNLAILIAQ